MRLWTLHPRYLDSKGLVALWREGLLAKRVLEDNTKGYKNHPQLIRFIQSGQPCAMIEEYLREVLAESRARGYRFDVSKISESSSGVQMQIPVHRKQVEYEMQLLRMKLRTRDPRKWAEMDSVDSIMINSVFRIIEGDIEDWEKVRQLP